MAAYFVSDIHLKNATEPNAVVFLSFLQRLSVEAATSAAESHHTSVTSSRAESMIANRTEESELQLFLVGDIFDLWIGAHIYFQNRFSEIISAIRHLVRAGVRVHYFEGNHDLHLHKFWADDVGVNVHASGQVFEIGGQRIYVEHGDQINPDDRGYLFLRWLLRTPVIKFLSENLPSRVVAGIGERASHASRDYTSDVARKAIGAERTRALIRGNAKKRGREVPCEYCITGHMHIFDDATIDLGDHLVRSINLGWWHERRQVLMIRPDCVAVDQLEVKMIELAMSSS